jgi:plastocyanin
MRSKVLGWVAGVVGLALLVSCGSSTSPYGGGGGGGGGGGHSSNLTVQNFAFNPTPDTVTAGTAVTFTWAAGSTTHNVTWDTGPTSPANSADMSSGAYTTPALSAGTYTYHCTFHVTTYNMRGTIVVK